jgi:hypothetical protein
MEFDNGDHGYLLPEGCKDLIDVLEPVGEVTYPSQETIDRYQAEFERLMLWDKIKSGFIYFEEPSA